MAGHRQTHEDYLFSNNLLVWSVIRSLLTSHPPVFWFFLCHTSSVDAVTEAPEAFSQQDRSVAFSEGFLQQSDESIQSVHRSKNTYNVCACNIMIYAPFVSMFCYLQFWGGWSQVVVTQQQYTQTSFRDRIRRSIDLIKTICRSLQLSISALSLPHLSHL